MEITTSRDLLNRWHKMKVWTLKQHYLKCSGVYVHIYV